MANKSPEELLPEADLAFLKDKHPGYKVYEVGSEVHVVLPLFTFPSAYTPSQADLLIRLPAGFPDAKPDMFWTKPDVKLVSGGWPTRADCHEVPGAGTGVEVYQKVSWQRWSRHWHSDVEWRIGVDGLRNFIGAIKSELRRQV